ncbi:inositol polyphosphate multikinase isoform X1 [Aedes aegypti]|uniref:Kinase n=2 Tax=Aedes aegypti TaxID=7159 RepID=A0A1S4F331_AEDAE|nr:inositol polyphosphate multikinase isoform X1 [Aedes aegypti]XP_021709290.1 inositol polyphosphate multikinase isoform X1 [Aedes aegypti]
MSIHHHHFKLPPYQKRKNNVTERKRHLSLRMSAGQDYPTLPEGLQPMDDQVAGHAFFDTADSVGLLKCSEDASVLKPAGKLLCGLREIKFYEQIQTATTETDLLALKDTIPQYLGHMKLPVDGKLYEFIKLSDLTYGMLEPCIMDVKIGCRTWDPQASEEKRKAEESKYQACKRNLGFCIPGFQVYSIANGRRMRYGKDYGKKLTEVTVKDAFRKFLNADSGLCRQLLMQFLSDLWTIQKWARTQTSFRLYSSSVLLVYDARRLKPVLQYQSKSLSSSSSKLTSCNTSSGPTGTGTSSTTSSPLGGPSSTPGTPTSGEIEPLQHYFKIQRSHSAFNNYEEDMKAMRENYVFMRDNLVGSYETKVWASARMIDFAHAFPAEESTIDSNYLQGVESLVKIFEDFLKDCELENSPKGGVP